MEHSLEAGGKDGLGELAHEALEKSGDIVDAVAIEIEGGWGPRGGGKGRNVALVESGFELIHAARVAGLAENAFGAVGMRVKIREALLRDIRDSDDSAIVECVGDEGEAAECGAER